MIQFAMAPSCQDVIRRHAETAYPAECCGLLVGTIDAQSVWSIHQAIPATNEASAEEAADRYQLAPGDYLQADRTARSQGLDIVGVYHSHPDAPAVPSRLDAERAWPRMIYLILTVDRGKAGGWRAWILDEAIDEAPPRLGEARVVSGWA